MANVITYYLGGESGQRRPLAHCGVAPFSISSLRVTARMAKKMFIRLKISAFFPFVRFLFSPANSLGMPLASSMGDA